MSEQAIKKILITGANGFIGGSLMRYYQNQGQDVVGIDLVGNADDIVEGDISQPRYDQSAVTRMRCNYSHSCIGF